MAMGKLVGLAAVVGLGLGAGCSGDKKDQTEAKAKAPDTAKATPAKSTAKTLAPRPRKPARFGCDIIKRMPSDGMVTAIEHVAGKDDLGMDVVGGKVVLRAGTTLTGSTWRFEMRGSYAEAENQGGKACVALSRLTFALPRSKPAIGKPIPYEFTGKIAEIPGSMGPAIYVDINENKQIVGTRNPTIEYVGTEGRYTFSELNKPDKNYNQHTVDFSVLFQKVTGGKLDPTVKTRLTGRFHIKTRRPL